MKVRPKKRYETKSEKAIAECNIKRQEIAKIAAQEGFKGFVVKFDNIIVEK